MSACPRTLRLTILLAGLFSTTHLASQAVSARAVIAAPKSSVHLGGVTTRANGVWAGLALDVQFGRFLASGSGTRGQLTPLEAGTSPDQDVGEISVDGRYDIRRWLGFELRYSARAFSSAAGRQRWDIVSAGIIATQHLGTPEVRAFARVAYLPVVTVSEEKAPSFAVGGESGIAVEPGRIPLVFVLSYRVERFDFPAATGRSQQFETVTLSVGLRARRLEGRWRLG